MDGEAPPLYGEDAVEIDGCTGDVYTNLASQRKGYRLAREEAENSFKTKDQYKLNFVQPHKEKRFKVYFRYEGRKGPPIFLMTRLPKHGGYEDGPSLGIKKMFVGHYNRLRELLSVYSIHLRSELGIAIPDEDAISGYVGYGGQIFVADGSAPGKQPEDQVYAWGKLPFSGPDGDMASSMLSLERKRITQIAVGTEHAVAVSSGGRVFSWGLNDYGQLGTGDEMQRMLPSLTEVPYEVFIESVSCGGRFTMALTKKGELWSWGRMQASNFPRLFVDQWCNGYESRGELGLRGKKLAKVVGGDTHMVALTKEGKVFTWGYNDYGQLGWGMHGLDRVGQQKPKQLDGLLENEVVADICSGGAHTAVVTNTGKVFAWGSNSIGQIGHGLRQCHPEPQEVSFSQKMVKCRAGWQCTMFITENQRAVICGGIAAEGPKVETNDQTNETPEGGEANGGPAAPLLGGSVLDLVSGGSDLLDADVVEGAIGEAHAIVACADGCVIGWGYNRQLQALGCSSDDTFVKAEVVVMADAKASTWKAVSVGVGGSQSYALLRPPRL
eukprot:GEMP01017026.1.p1 GENE.GEMP01017026.1~~GEMP01017026.1.p1  ORF type:complete len:553 (+),score=121.03 GEMP01017026.1:72-1730(+)